MKLILGKSLGGKNLGVHSAVGEGAGVEDKEVLGGVLVGFGCLCGWVVGFGGFWWFMWLGGWEFP